MLLKLSTTILFFGCTDALRACNEVSHHRNPRRKPMIRPNEVLLEGIRGGTAEGRPKNIDTVAVLDSGNSTTGNATLTSSDVLAACDGEGTDLEALEDFLKEAQLALLGYNGNDPSKDPHSKDLLLKDSYSKNPDLYLKDSYPKKNGIVRYQIRVKFAPTLQDFLAGRTEANASESEDGIITIRAMIHAFIEPNWHRADHRSSGGTPLGFVRDPHDDAHHGGAAEASPAETSPLPLNQALEQALRDSPTIALKLIRREALEELRRDCLQKSDGVSPNDETNNGLNGSDKNAKNKGPQQATTTTGPGNGDADAARRINRLAVEWFLRRNMGPYLASSTVLSDFSIVCQDDCVLSTQNATTRFVQSRVSIKVQEAKETNGSRNRRLELILQSPSLATPIRGVRPRGTGCTFCKVLHPQWIAKALATAGCKTRVVTQRRTRIELWK